MKFWIVTQTMVNRPGGIATHVRLLQQGLKFCGHEAHCLSADYLPRPIARLAVSLPMRVLNRLRPGAGIEYALKFHTAGMRRQILRRLKWAEPPQVFACQDLASAHAVRSIRDEYAPNSTIVLTVHSHYTFEKVGQGWMAPASVGERRTLEIERRGMAAADALVCVSEKMRNHVIELVGPTLRPITVLHNAIDVDRFAPPVSTRQKKRCRRQLAVDEDVPLLLIAGHLQEIKGVHVAVEAAQILRERGEWFCLMFVGDGPMRSRLESQIHRYRLGEFVRLMGAVEHDRIPVILKAADMLLMPSIPSYRAEESFGLSAIEAMSSGLPVVASRTGGLAEIVRDRQTGLLVPPGDPELLAQAVRDILEDPVDRLRLGEEARDYAVSHHDHVAHARQYAAIAETALGAAGGAAVVRMAG